MHKIDIKRASDGELLTRFEEGRDCRALEELIHRYGGMVRATVRRCLDHETDVDDAFQATFFSLAKLAGKVKNKAAVAGWLQKTARSTSVNIVREQARWKRGAAHMTENHKQRINESIDCADPTKKAANAELKQVLDEEVARLSEPLRDALVLCDLQGKTQKTAAKLLGISVSTVNERVAKARRLLRERLIRRGVTLTVAGLATCVASLVETVSANVVREVAKNATLYAAGNSAAEIGVASIVTQSANKVILAMTKAKLLAVALLATTILLFAGSISGLVGSSGGTAKAGTTIFFDDFNDGNHADGTPATWQFSPFNVGDITVQDGSLTLSPNDQTEFDGTQIAVGVGEAISCDMSIRTQLRVGKDGDTATVGGRIQPSGLSFIAAVGYDTNLGGSYVALGKPTGDTVRETEFLPALLGGVTPLLPFDVRRQDAEVQLDMIGDEVTVWAWQANSDRPEEPLFRITDDTFSEPGFPAIGVLVAKPSAPLSDHGATFGYVHVADASIPEPSSAQLGLLGAGSLGLLIRQRRRWA